MIWLRTLFRQIAAVYAKELTIEWRDLSRTSTVFFFSLTMLLMIAFAMPGTYILPDVAGGALWIGLLLASTRSLDQSFTVELETGALEGLVLWPVDPLAIFYGKALANASVLILVAAALTPLLIVLYHPPLSGSPFALLTIIVLGAGGLAAPGTLVAALTSQARGSSALMPFLLLPLVVPVVVFAAKGTTLVLVRDPMEELDTALKMLLIFNTAHWALDGLLFTRIVDEG